MSRDRCCVPGCFKSGNSHPVLHGFPNPNKYPELFRSWIYAVGGEILALDNQYIYKLRRICHGHFEEKYCCRFNRISNIAVPTINLPGQLAISHDIAERRPLRTKQNLMIDTPSCSKDPVIYEECEIVCQQNVIQQVEEKENIMLVDDPVIHEECEVVRQQNVIQQVEGKENIMLIDDPAVTTHLKVNPILEETTATNVGANAQRVKNISKKSIRRVAVTKAEQKLYKTLQAVKIKLSKCRNKVKKQRIELKSARQLFSNPEFLKVMDNWTTSAKIFTLMQFKQSKKKSKGRRFSTEEKIVSLTMMKQSPKAYRFLRKIFVLPSCQTLIKLINKCYLRPGINEIIFTQLKIRGEKIKEEHKLCVLAFDEMQLKPGIAYNERKDKVSGFVTNGEDTHKILADHAQVFLIRGLIKNFKQAIAYTFSAGATKGLELAKQLKAIITELQKAGFNVVATVCDQGTNNCSAIKYLKEETHQNKLRKGLQIRKENLFSVNNFDIIPLFDPPHLLKGIRNNLLTKNLKYQINGKIGIAKWSHLEMLYKEDPGYNGIKLMPTLTESHIVPSKIPKMKVKYASQIFSKKVASNMGYFAAKQILPEECKETADFLLFMDDLFDSVNGSYNKNRFAKPLLGPVGPNSPHIKTWRDAKSALNTFEFINKNNKKESVPTIRNWITTLDGMDDLIRKLEKEYNITSLWMRHLNQDPLENFFGAIRSYGCRNNNPTADQFESAFASLLINNLTSTHAPGANCENDDATSLYSLLVDKECEVNKTCEIDLNDILEIKFTPVASKSDPRVMAPLEYISGYFIKKSKEKVWKGCPNCKKALCSREQKEYIKYREYAGRNWLHSPNDKFIKSLSELQDISNYILKKYIDKPLLKTYTMMVATCLIDFNYINCPAHRENLREFLTKSVIRFFLYSYCKNINKIMYGKKEMDDSNDLMQMLAKSQHKKFFKYKK